MADDPRSMLRRIFADELDEHVATLEHASSVLAAGADTDDDGRSGDAERELVAEVYRAVHSLKGAARAAGLLDVERYCHGLEALLGPIRDAPARDRPALSRLTGEAARVLGAAALDLRRRSYVDRRIFAETRSEVTPAAAPNPSARAAPGEDDAGGGRAESPGGDESVRVVVARLNELQATVDAIHALVAREVQHSAEAERQSISAVQHELRRALDAARIAARGPGRSPEAEQLLGRLDVASEALRGVAERWIDRQASSSRAWREGESLAALAAARCRALRLVSVDTLRAPIEQTVLDLAGQLGRDVEFRFDGQVEIDRHVRDALREPLLHLVRNAVDHGIEDPRDREAAGKPARATLSVTAGLRGHDAEIRVADDGRGIDIEAVRRKAQESGLPQGAEALDVIFEPGFSTRAASTEVSGRGIGLDIVRQRVARLQGRVAVHTEAGRGTAFTLVVPLDLSVLRGVLVRARERLVVFPTTAVERLARVGPDEILALGGKMFLRHGDERLPLAELGEVLGLSLQARPPAKIPCVVLIAGSRRAALLVDELIDEREHIVRAFGARIERVPFFFGAVVLGESGVAYVADVAEMVNVAQPGSLVPAQSIERRRILVVDDSVTTRQLERTLLEAAGFDVTVAPDGAAAWDVLQREAAFDLVVSDVEMPRLDGFQLLARVRGHRPTASLPVILVTALESDADRQRALELGASAYVLKRSFNQDAFMSTLESFL